MNLKISSATSGDVNPDLDALIDSSPHSAAYMRQANRASIGSDNGLSPIRHQAINLTNAGLLSIGHLGTNFSEILIKIQNFSFTKISSENVWEMAAILSRGEMS